jgi:hypothetical protein
MIDGFSRVMTLAQSLPTQQRVFPLNPPLPGSFLPVVAAHYGVTVRTIYNDLSLGLGLAPSLSPVVFSEDLLQELHQVRKWCFLYKKFTYFTYRNFLIEKTAGTISQTLDQYQAYFQ